MENANFIEIRKNLIQDIIRLAREKYVYPEAGEKIAAYIQARFESGEYDEVTQGSDLAFSLTNDLRHISNDLHWNVLYRPQGFEYQVDPEKETDPERIAYYVETLRKTNFGFERLERLKGNIGYIDLRRFDPSEYAGETAVTAFNFIANCDALIIDLRKNIGGYPSMVQLITSYLYDPVPRHINTFYYRPTDDIQQFWTFPHVPGKRRPDIPVYVLISSVTGSAAEEFTYNLRQMKRATLVGETTLGMAHPVTREVVQGIFDVNLPYGRPINPITGTNWEGTGVEPHINVPAEEALKTAHLQALEQLVSHCQNDDERKNLTWIAEIIESDYSPVQMDDSDLSRYAGEYGKRRFYVENGSLYYGHSDFPESWKLSPMTQTRFRLDEDLKFEFLMDQTGKSSAVKIFYAD